MKKILMVALVAIFAIACGSKNSAVETKFNEYQTSIDELTSFVDIKEIDNAGDPLTWFNQREKQEQDAIAKACFELQTLQRDMSKWIGSLTKEEQTVVDELRTAKLQDDEYVKKMRYVFKVQGFINRANKPILKQRPGLEVKQVPAPRTAK